MKTLFAVVLLCATFTTARADDLVLSAQTQLARLGYYRARPDGTWGQQTAAAVRRFQQAKELRITGELNPATLNALGIKTNTTAAPPSRAVALADLFVGGPYLTAPPELQVQTVKKAQQNLKMLGFYRGPVDARPNTALTEALRAYQKDHRFKPSGRLDNATLQALDLFTPPPEDF